MVINNMDIYNLKRFLDAQESSYSTALEEIKNGRKDSHWMWFIFPQIKGLGYSSISQYYSISCLKEATLYLEHEVLGARLVEISKVLLELNSNDDISYIMGSPDDLKLRSSMTLFSLVPSAPSVFQEVLNRYYRGLQDLATVQIMSQES